MNIITLVLDFFYEISYGLNSAHLIIIAILLALFYNWAFNRGYDARTRRTRGEASTAR